MPPVTLQISLAPSDFAHARYLLAHQISVWRPQVDEIVLSIDMHRSSGRFSARWQEGEKKIIPLAESIPGARVVKVNYGATCQSRIADEFFGGRTPVPAKDFRGGPYYSYFFGLNAATHDHVFHMDSDMFFGGLSPHWLKEAVADQASDPRILFSAPLPGPPDDDQRLHSQISHRVEQRVHTHDFDSMSTRLFLVSRTRLSHTLCPLIPRRPSLRNTLKALVEGNPPQHLPEDLISHAMRLKKMVRREFLGSAPGMWHLHPPYRCADFYAKIPMLIQRCETNDMPVPQRGDHDINASLVDWSEALSSLKTNRWWRRLLHRNS